MKTRKPLFLSERREIRKTIYEKAGYCLTDYLICQAFTRSSYSRAYGGGSIKLFILKFIT